MKKLVDFKSPQGHYVADACIVWCFDHRFSGAGLLEVYKKNQRLMDPDLVSVAGGAKGLAMPEGDPWRTYILNQIAISVEKHYTKKIVLMMHTDCGACENNTNPTFYASELSKAHDTVRKVYPSMPIATVFADFTGLYSI